MLDFTNRYFEASTFLLGKKNITPSNPEDAINLYEYTLNMQLSRILKNDWSFTFDLPISSNTIASKIEHASGYRHSTHTFGIGDIRFTV